MILYLFWRYAIGIENFKEEKVMKKIMAIVLAVLMIASFAACTGDSANNPTNVPSGNATTDPNTTGSEVKKFKIGLSIMELTAYTWFQGVEQGARQWLAENGAAKGVDLEFQVEDSHSDPQTMLNNIENLTTAGCNGIILAPADPSSAIPLMKEKVAQGIPFVIVDYAQEAASPADEVWSTFVGHDMKALGVTAGQVAVEYLKTLNKDDPKCLFIQASQAGQVGTLRYEGFSETVLAAFPKAQIIVEGVEQQTRDAAATLMDNILTREGDTIDVVSGHNDAIVFGAYTSTKAKGYHSKFVGIAGDKDVLTLISDGDEYWLGEVLQDPVVLGYQATDAIVKVLVDHETLDKSYPLPQPEAITPANVKNYDWESWGWLG